MSLARVWALAALATACSPAPPCGLRACDIRQPDCQRMAAQAAACLLGESPRDIPVEMVSRRQYLAEQVASQQDPVREKLRLGALAELDLAEPDLTPEDAALVLSDRVAAYFDVARKRIVIIVDDGDTNPLDGWWNTSLLVHEMTHALQDAGGRLVYPPADGDLSYDRIFARGALVEGEASLTETLTTLGLFGHEPADVPWQQTFARLRDLIDAAAALSPAPADLAYSYFAYPYGLATTQRAHARGGVAAVAALWRTPPVSARQVMLGVTSSEVESPIVEELGTSALPVLPAELTLLAGDRMGAYVFKLWLRRLGLRLLPQNRARLDWATDLRGDYLSLFHQGESTFAFWRLRLGSAANANAIGAFLASARPLWKVEVIDRDVIVLAHTRGTPAPTPMGWRAPDPPPAAARLTMAAMAVGPRTTCVRSALTPAGLPPAP